MENSAQWWSLSISSSKDTTHFTRRSHQPCTILWMAATIVKNSVWYSVYGQGSIYLGWYYQYKEFTFLVIRKSTPTNTMPFSAAISVNAHHIPWHGIHGTLQPDETPMDHKLIHMFVYTAQEEKTAVIVQKRRLMAVCCCNKNVAFKCTCCCVIWSFIIWRLLTFMMELRVHST